MPRGRTKAQGAPPELIAAGRKTQVLIQDMPRCKAIARSTGKPCGQPAMSDGTGLCRQHNARKRRKPNPDAQAIADACDYVRRTPVPRELAAQPVWQWAWDQWGMRVKAQVLRAWLSRDMDNGQAWRAVLSRWRDAVHG